MLFQVFGKEIRGRRIGRQPIAMQQEVVDLVRKYEFFDVDSLLAQSLRELDCLRKLNIAIIVTLNQ